MGNYEQWSLAFNIGMNKPYNTLSMGYATFNPSFYPIDLGTAYSINPYIGIKTDINYNNFKNKNNTKEFDSN